MNRYDVTDMASGRLVASYIADAPTAPCAEWGESYSVQATDITNTIDDPRWVELRRQRDGRIDTTKWIQGRYLDEIALGIQTTLTANQYQAWLEYWQALRDLPATTTDPENPAWPTPPEGTP